MNSAIVQSAIDAYTAGLSIVPPCEDGTKAPEGTWKQYERQRATRDTLRQWYGPRTGLGTVCGKVSGNLEVLDFDARDVYDAFVELAQRSGLGDLIQKIETGYVEDTPSLGVHWLYRCETIEGNKKLARRPKRPEERRDPDDKIKTLIETKGEGGYIILAPSNGKVHPSGNAYRLRAGSFATIPILTPDERRTLIDLARTFDAMPKLAARDRKMASEVGGRPGDDFNARASWDDVLTGWTVVYTDKGTTYWRRPGKKNGISATTNHGGLDLLIVFSTSTAFEATTEDAKQGYSKFSAYAVLNHGGDFTAAARDLVAKGYGEAGFPLTEAGDAECFADLYRDGVRYDHHRGRWLVSDEMSGIWVPDPVERLTQMTINMARERQRQATAIENVERKKAAWAWAIKGEGRGRINNTLALARSVPPIADEGLNWDQDAFLLGVQNGVVDLQTGQWRKATADDRVTMRVRVAYDDAATCPLWLKTLEGIFAPRTLFTAEDSRLLVDFMQRAIGYSITGDCREECCFFTWGEGSNGKGTVMNTLGWLFGDYTDDMPYSTLERSAHGGGIPNDVAKLEGKRFITCAEVNEFTINEARLKALTGRDPMTARFLHQEFFTFIPVGKIWIATNNKPKIVGMDDGIWRRIHLIPFIQKFEGGNINKALKDELRQELPGILNWVIDGSQKWLRKGLNPPESVKAATATYRHESNPITPFVEACCIKGERLRMQAAPAFQAYEKFCNDTNLEPWLRVSDKAFHKAMRLVFKADTGKQTFYLGVGFKVAPQERESG